MADPGTGRPQSTPHTTLETHHEEGESWEPYEGSDNEDPYDAYIAYDVDEPDEPAAATSVADADANGGQSRLRPNPPYLNILTSNSQPNLSAPASADSTTLPTPDFRTTLPTPDFGMALPTPDFHMALPTPDFRSPPPPEYEAAFANDLTQDFSRLRMSDPNPQFRAMDGQDPAAGQPLPPSQTSQSLNGNDYRPHHQTVRSVTMPPTPEQQAGWAGPPRSASVQQPMKSYTMGPEIVLENGDGGSIYSTGSTQSGGYVPIGPPGQYSGGYGAPRNPYGGYYGPSPWQQQQQPQPQYGMYGQPQAYAQPVQPDPLYAAASDLLGLPPGAQPARMPGIPGGYPNQMSPPAQNLPPYPQNAPGLYRGPSIASSMRSQYSGNSAQSSNSSTLAVPSAGLPLPRAPSPGLQRGPTTGGATGLQRSTTSASSITTLNTRKTKAIDLNQPPFTREYIEQYRARIKVDPDPEAHFQFAKYLIEAAKKVGAHAPDQKAVLRYRTGLISEALKVIKKLATSADPLPDAQFFLATCYGTGMLGLQIDHEKSYQFYVAAAKLRHPAASYRVAVCNELGAGTKRDLSRAVAFYRQAASLGDTPAMYKLGMVLLTPSLGQKKDEKEAVKWLRRAAEQADEENPHGLHELGLLHETGECSIVPKDEACARELFTRGGNLGYTKSCLKLGACYEYGALTCPVDPKRSIAWYTRAAEKNDPEAELALSGWYLTGCESVLKQSDHEAYLWARRAANKGLPKAEYAVGYYAEVGIGIKPDIEFAKKWYLRAAAQGHQRSKERLTQLKMASSKRLGLTRPTRQQAKDECVIM